MCIVYNSLVHGRVTCAEDLHFNAFHSIAEIHSRLSCKFVVALYLFLKLPTKRNKNMCCVLGSEGGKGSGKGQW